MPEKLFSDEVLPDLSATELHQVVERFPHCRRLLEVDTTVEDYYQGLTIDQSTLHPQRAGVFLETLRRQMDDLLPSGTSSGVIDQLVRSPVLSTAEHMASNTNPQTLNVVINQALYRRHRNQAYILALPCTAIQLENILLSRDLFIGDHKLHLLSARYKKTLVAEAPPVDYEYVGQSLRVMLANGDSRMRARASELRDWWERTYRAISHLDMFWKQLVVLNYSYWKEFVSTNHMDLPDVYISAPACILVRDVMIEDLQANRGGWFYDIVFDPARRDATYRTFDGIRSCWDSETRSGTFLFWTMNGKGEPKAMTYADGILKSDGVAGELELTRESVLAALKSGSIYPGSFLVLGYLGLYLGLQLFGGILQVQYYPEIRRRITAGNPLGLSAVDLEAIGSLQPDLYLNFEKRELSDGGLLKLCYPQSADIYQEYGKRPFRQEIMGCIGYLAELSK